MSYKFMDEIGSDIDFVLIDTAHVNPGEILDFLIILPYLKDNATIVFHDTKLDTYKESRETCFTNNTLMSAIYGEKLVKGDFVKTKTATFANIGAIKLTAETRNRLWEVFNLLTIKWEYLPCDDDFNALTTHFERFYDQEFIEYFKDVITLHKNRFASQLSEKPKKNFKYYRYKILSKIGSEEKRKHYQQKCDKILKQCKSFLLNL